ncbi:MAG: hypothetical protein WD294_01800 [Phycisphaeraceae bacterium]
MVEQDDRYRDREGSRAAMIRAARRAAEVARNMDSRWSSGVMAASSR